MPSIYRSAGMAVHVAEGERIALPPDAAVRRVARRWWECYLPGSRRRIAVHVPRAGGGDAVATFFGTRADKVALRDWFRAEGGESGAVEALWKRRAEPRLGAVLRRWPTWECRGLRRTADGFENFNARMTIAPRGELPAPLVATGQGPTYLDADGGLEAVPSNAQLRIDRLFKPTIGETLAGHRLAALLEEVEQQ